MGFFFLDSLVHDFEQIPLIAAKNKNTIFLDQ